MEIPINNDLLSICKDIERKNLTENQWAETESDDMFQVGSFIGGFDADEKEFCFSYFSPNKTEYWFQFSLNTVKKLLQNKTISLMGRELK